MIFAIIRNCGDPLHQTWSKEYVEGILGSIDQWWEGHLYYMQMKERTGLEALFFENTGTNVVLLDSKKWLKKPIRILNPDVVQEVPSKEENVQTIPKQSEEGVALPGANASAWFYYNSIGNGNW